MRPLGDEGVDANDIREGQACFGKDRRDVPEAELGLRAGILRHAVVGSDAKLPGAKDQAVPGRHLDAVAVAGEGRADRFRVERPKHDLRGDLHDATIRSRTVARSGRRHTLGHAAFLCNPFAWTRNAGRISRSKRGAARRLESGADGMALAARQAGRLHHVTRVSALRPNPRN